jgi:hypothetical protein
MAEGTVLISVTSPAAGRSGSSRASAARITVPPQARVTNSSKIERSKAMEVAASTPLRSSSEKTWRAQRAKATALPCSRATPLGRPVEPEV